MLNTYSREISFLTNSMACENEKDESMGADTLLYLVANKMQND